MHERPFRIIYRILQRILVLVKRVEVSCAGFQDGTTMSAAAERHIHIDALGLDVQTLNRLVQHRRYVVHVVHQLFLLILLRRRAANSV